MTGVNADGSDVEPLNSRSLPPIGVDGSILAARDVRRPDIKNSPLTECATTMDPASFSRPSPMQLAYPNRIQFWLIRRKINSHAPVTQSFHLADEPISKNTHHLMLLANSRSSDAGFRGR